MEPTHSTSPSPDAGPGTDTLTPGALVALTDATFDDEITNRPGIALVEFGASWCAPCRMMAPVLQRLVERLDALRATVRREGAARAAA